MPPLSTFSTTSTRVMTSPHSSSVSRSPVPTRWTASSLAPLRNESSPSSWWSPAWSASSSLFSKSSTWLANAAVNASPQSITLATSWPTRCPVEATWWIQTLKRWSAKTPLKHLLLHTASPYHEMLKTKAKTKTWEGKYTSPHSTGTSLKDLSADTELHMK